GVGQRGRNWGGIPWRSAFPPNAGFPLVLRYSRYRPKPLPPRSPSDVAQLFTPCGRPPIPGRGLPTTAPPPTPPNTATAGPTLPPQGRTNQLLGIQLTSWPRGCRERAALP